MSMIRRLKSQGCGPETPSAQTRSLPQTEAVFGFIEKPEKLPYSATSLTIISWIVSLIFF